MLSAVFRTRTYLDLRLPPRLYGLTILVVGGYFCSAVITSLLRRRNPELFSRIPVELRAACYAVFLYVAILHSAEPQSFIYFQF